MNKLTLWISSCIFSLLFFNYPAFASTKPDNKTIINMVKDIKQTCGKELPKLLNDFTEKQAKYIKYLIEEKQELKALNKITKATPIKEAFVPDDFKSSVNKLREKTRYFNTDFEKFLSEQKDSLDECIFSIDQILKIHKKDLT